MSMSFLIKFDNLSRGIPFWVIAVAVLIGLRGTGIELL